MSGPIEPSAFAAGYLRNVGATITALSAETVAAALDELRQAHERDAQVFLAGNGGSAATASHMANDFTWGLVQGGRRPLRAIALTDNVPTITAIANDSSYENVFSGQLDALGRPGDLLLAITGSGNSPNIVRAVNTARRLRMRTVALLGRGGGKVRGMVHVAVVVASDDYGPIEDVHMIFDHLATAYLRAQLLPAARGEPEGSTSTIVALRPALFLDRDGVLVHDADKVEPRRALDPLPASIQAIRLARAAGLRVFVISNQAIVARGIASEEEVRASHAALGQTLEREGATVDAFYFCPHHPNATVAAYRVACECRKPRPGMLLEAARRWDIDLSASVMIGDRLSDVAAGKLAGCRAGLLTTGQHNAPPIESPEAYLDVVPDFVAADLLSAMPHVLGFAR
jgi:D-sedoheptulose 7-phosphate isomerase